ncbi:MAG: hypothetical protein U0637_00180 [Phycisphaerales bacterium]
MRKSSQTLAAALVIAAGLASVVPSALADAAVPQQSPGLAKLLTAFPGVRYDSWQGAPLQFYGVPMSQGATPDLAAQQWLADFGDAFGAGALELTPDRANEVDYGRFNAFVFNQVMDGLPVEMGAVRLLVLNAPTREDPSALAHRVVMASARVAQRPAGGFPKDTTTADQATGSARALDIAKTLDVWEKPSLCVYFGEGSGVGRVPPARCWKVVGYSSTDAEQSYTVYVNAATGAVVAAQSNVHHDVIGRVRALATPPNNTAPSATNPPIQRFVPEIRVAIDGEAGAAFTDSSGFFRITRTATTPVTLLITTTQGHWVNVQNQADQGQPAGTGNEIAVARTGYASNSNLVTDITSGAAGASQENVAQVNTFLAVNDTHNFFRSRSGDWNRIDERLPANVMLDQTCNAFFSGAPRSVNFFRAGGGCTNTGWGNVVNHEYGHYIVNRLQLGQGAFGEGFGDCMAILINDSPIIGAGFNDDGSPVRHVVNDNVQYPCDDPGFESHYCGEILGGTIWEMRNAFVQSFGLNSGLAELRQLFVDWALTTAGGRNENPIDPTSIPEFLVVDDNDGFFCTGTPHHAQILAGFAARNMFPQGDPFVEDRVRISVPTPAPEVIPSGSSRTVNLSMVPESATIVPGSERLLYRTARDLPWITQPLTSLGSNNYRAQLPVLRCTDAIEYQFVVDTDRGSVAFPTPGCGGGYYFMRSDPPEEDLIDAGSDDFEAANPDWTESVADGAVDGRWIRAIPAGSSVVDLCPSVDTTAQGVNCWVTENGPLSSPPEDNDVDAGAVILTSPRMDLSGFTDVIFVYNRWFSNGKGTNPFEDIFRVDVSDDDGVTWHIAQVVGPSQGANTVGGWVLDSSFTLNFSGAHTGTHNRVRFMARDDFGDSLVEAAIDDLRVVGSVCQLPCDSIDFNRDGLLPDVQDIADFISVFSGGPCSTNDCADIDFNNDDLFPDEADIQAMLNAFSGGACD